MTNNANIKVEAAPTDATSAASLQPLAAASVVTPSRKRSLANSFTHAWQIDLTGIVACVLLTAAAYFVAVAPAMDRRDADAASRVALVDARDRVTGLTSSLRTTRTQLTDAQAALAKVEIPLQSATTVNVRLAALADLAVQCGLDVQHTQTGAVSVADSKRFARLPIQFAGTGSYRACETFLHRLAQQFPDTGMKSFTLDGSPTESGGNISFGCELIWYVQAGK